MTAAAARPVFVEQFPDRRLTIAPETAGTVGEIQPQETPGVGVRPQAEQEAGRGPVENPDPAPVTGADGHVAALQGPVEFGQGPGIVGMVGVHREDPVRPQAERFPESREDRGAVPRLPGPGEEMDPAVPAGQAGHRLAGSVRGTVVHHQDPKFGLVFPDAGDQGDDVIPFVIGGDHHHPDRGVRGVGIGLHCQTSLQVVRGLSQILPPLNSVQPDW